MKHWLFLLFSQQFLNYASHIYVDNDLYEIIKCPTQYLFNCVFTVIYFQRGSIIPIGMKKNGLYICQINKVNL